MENNDDQRFERINMQLEAQSSKIDTKFDHLSNKIELMASSVSELAQAVAKKEVSDHHIKEQLAELKTDVKEAKTNVNTRMESMSKDIDNLKLVSAGDTTMRKVFWAVLSLLVLGVGGAIINLVVSK